MPISLWCSMSGRGAALRFAAAVTVLLSFGAVAQPNPFDPSKTDIPVVESGSDAARAVGETVEEASSDPFAGPVDIVESGSGEARAAGEEIRPDSTPATDPFGIPVDIVESGTSKARDLAGEMLPLDPIADPLEGWTPRNPQEQGFLADSDFPPNTDEDAGLYRFDLRMVQYVDSGRAKGKFTQYVNSRDGSVALLEPEAVIRALGGQPIPDVVIEFLLLRPGASGLACGRHKEIGNGCIAFGGQMSVGMGQLERFDGLYAWLESVAGVPQRKPGVGSGARPDADTGFVRGRLPRGDYMSLWRESDPSRIPTNAPWLGFGAGLYKDYQARQNRVAQVVVWEGADLNRGDVAFKLLELAPDQRSFDTRSYPLVTTFSAKGISSANELGMKMMTETMAKAKEYDTALRACPKGSAGRACREKYRGLQKELNESARDEAFRWALEHGLPFKMN